MCSSRASCPGEVSAQPPLRGEDSGSCLFVRTSILPFWGGRRGAPSSWPSSRLHCLRPRRSGGRASLWTYSRWKPLLLEGISGVRLDCPSRVAEIAASSPCPMSVAQNPRWTTKTMTKSSSRTSRSPIRPPRAPFDNQHMPRGYLPGLLQNFTRRSPTNPPLLGDRRRRLGPNKTMI